MKVRAAIVLLSLVSGAISRAFSYMVGFMMILLGAAILTPVPECPRGMEVGDMIEHRTGTQGVLLECQHSYVKVSTGENHRNWQLFELHGAE